MMTGRFEKLIPDLRAGTLGRLAAAGFCLLLLTGLNVPLGVATAQEALSFGGIFHSIQRPRKTTLSLPSIGDITLWRSHMEKARLALRRKQYKKARRNLIKALNKGNFIAAWYLGYIYSRGLGVKADARMAFDYYRAVALKYTPDEPRRNVVLLTVDSLYRVAETYRRGNKRAKIARDLPRALRILLLAAGRGHPGAQYSLGLMYLKGAGVKKSARQAVKWLRLSAQKRYLRAEVLLGNLYWSGKRVKRSKVEALKWYALATRSTRPELNPDIYDRFDAMMAKSSERNITDAEGRAAIWDKHFPVGFNAAIIPVSE